MNEDLVFMNPDGKKSKTQKKVNVPNELLEKEVHKPLQPKKKEFDLQQFIESQQKPNLTKEKLEKEQEYLLKIRNSVIPNKYYKIENSIKFFEQNISYFVNHSLEFQRLVGQLEINERQIFLNHIYTYYYPGIFKKSLIFRYSFRIE